MKQELFLRKVSRESFKNAEQFVKDAEILLKKKSYAHAYALAVLGEEELAKAVMYTNATNGLLGINGKWRKELVKHTGKQRIASNVAFWYELVLIAEDAVYFAKKKAKGNVEKFIHVLQEKVSELLQEEGKMFAIKLGDIYEHLEPFEEIQRRREEAMYVDVNLKEQRISSPKDFKRKTAKRYISHVAERLDAFRDEVGKKMSATDKEIAIATQKTILNQLNEEGKKRLLEWYGISEKDLIN